MDIINTLLVAILAPTTAAYVLAAIGLNIHFGFTGLLNMGQAGFMLIGAYGFAIPLSHGNPLWVGVLSAIACAIGLGLLLGVPTLKLRGDYLAIVTISAAEIIRYAGKVSNFTEWTGGSNGLPGPTYRTPFSELSPLGTGTFKVGPWGYAKTGIDDWWTRLVAWGLVALCLLLVWLLMRSPWGRVLRGIREDEDAVRSLGKNVYSYKMQSLLIGGVMGALGGIIFVLPSSVQPDGLGRQVTFFVWTAMLMGGAATIFGPVLGCIMFFWVRILLETFAADWIPTSIMNDAQAQQFAKVAVGVVLMLLVIFRPQGVLGNKRELRFNV